MENNTDRRRLRILLLLLTAGAILFVLGKLSGGSALNLIQLLRSDNESAVADFLKREGTLRGGISVALLSVIQVMSVVIPGLVIQIAAGMIYPFWLAFLFCYLGFCTGHFLVFFIVRHTIANPGMSRLEDMPEKMQNNWIMQTMRKASPFIVVMLACFVPGMPNGIIPYIAARTSITHRDFALAILFSSWVQILCNTLAGTFLVQGNYLYTVITFFLQIGIIALVVKNRERILARFGRK